MNDIAKTTKPSRFEDVVIVACVVGGFGGAIALGRFWGDAPPVMLAFLVGTGVASLVYRFLGGIGPETSFKIGAFKAGGTLAALVGVAWLVDKQLVIEAKNEAQIVGTFENLNAYETISSTASMYVRRRYSEQNTPYSYDWRIITPRPMAEGETVPFYFDRGPTTSEGASSHELVVRSQFYDQRKRVRIWYSRERDQLLMVFGDTVELKAIASGRSLPDPASRNWAFGMVRKLYAQAVALPASDVLRQLESPDPIIRRNARQQLAKKGRAAVPLVRTALQDPASSYRIRLGVIVAINGMQGITAEDLRGAPFRAILKAVGDADTTLAGEAFRLFARLSVGGALDSVRPAVGPKRVRVKGARSAEGDFEFRFLLSQSGISAMRLGLEEIACYEDGSVRTTGWSFSAFVNGREVTIPGRSYTDVGKPQRYTTAPADRTRWGTTLPLASRLRIRVVGYKPHLVR